MMRRERNVVSLMLKKFMGRVVTALLTVKLVQSFSLLADVTNPLTKITGIILGKPLPS